jgi:abortive infection bacteriophage resistance protein
MEFRLNKIDTELRQVVNEATKEGKVHGNKEVSTINKDGRQNKQDDKNNFKKQLDEKKEKKIVVEAVKTKEIDIEASKEDSIPNLTFGRFLDTKR